MKREESQNVEYKESWHDKYLEWVCGYANICRIQSRRRNKCLADVFERLDLMERKGSGFKKHYEDYEKLSVNLGKRMPSLESESDYFRVTLPNLLYGFTDEQLVAAVDNSEYGVAKDKSKTAKTHHDEVPLKPNEIELLQELSSRGELGAAELRKAMKLRNAPDFRERYLRPLPCDGYIEFTLPNAKRSKLQEYRLTVKGRDCLASFKSHSNKA